MRNKIDKKAIANEIDRKLKLEESFANRSINFSPMSTSKSKSRPVKKTFGSKSKLSISKSKRFKKSSTNNESRNKQSRSDSSKQNSMISTENDKSIPSTKNLSKTLKRKDHDSNKRLFDQFIDSNNISKKDTINSDSIAQNAFNKDLRNPSNPSNHPNPQPSTFPFPKVCIYLKDIMFMLIRGIEDFQKSIDQERDEPTVREFRKILTIFDGIERNGEDERRSVQGDRISDCTKIQEEHQQEKQHIDEYRRRVEMMNETQETSTRVSRKNILKPLNRPHSEGKLRKYNTPKNFEPRGRQGLYGQKLSPLKNSNSTTAVRECRNYIEEENRFIIKTKKNIKNSFMKLKGMNTHKTVSKKHRKPPVRDLNKMLAKQVFKFSDD